MDDEIEPAPQVADAVEQRVHHVRPGDVGGHDDGRAGALAQRDRAARDRLDILVGKRDLRPLGCRSARDAPGQRAVVRHAHDQPAPAGHQVAGYFDRLRSRLRHAPFPLGLTEYRRG